MNIIYDRGMGGDKICKLFNNDSFSQILLFVCPSTNIVNQHLAHQEKKSNKKLMLFVCPSTNIVNQHLAHQEKKSNKKLLLFICPSTNNGSDGKN